MPISTLISEYATKKKVHIHENLEVIISDTLSLFTYEIFKTILYLKCEIYLT